MVIGLDCSSVTAELHCLVVRASLCIMYSVIFGVSYWTRQVLVLASFYLPL